MIIFWPQIFPAGSVPPPITPLPGIVGGLLPHINDILAVRDQVGARLKLCKIVTRTWSGSELGEGTPTETETYINPSPRVVELTENTKIPSGGAVKNGDILLKMISKQTFQTKDLIDCSSDQKNVEKFYLVGTVEYQVIKVTEKHVTWSVHLRQRSQQG